MNDSSSTPSPDERAKADRSAGPLREDTVRKALTRVGICLNILVDKTSLDLGDIPPTLLAADELNLLIVGGKHVGILIKETKLAHPDDVFDLVDDGLPVIFVGQDGSFYVCEKTLGRKIEVSVIDQRVTRAEMKSPQLRALITDDDKFRTFVAKKELECESLSAAPALHRKQHHGHEHEHPTPLRRFIALLSLDRRDIWTIILFALVAGILALATPLAIESMVNVVSWGTYLQPLLVLAVMLLACLGLAGVLRVLQTVVVEMIQRRQLVRIVGDLAHRFPRANRRDLRDEFPRELANRVFDIMTIQKATAVLLLDGVNIVLTTVLGLLLLAFYHPFLLGFDIVLMISMISLTWMLGRGGIRTAIDESIMKYRIAHWLQDVLAAPSAFKINGGEPLAIERANQLVAEYIEARQSQFRVVIRQVTFAIGLQVIASTAVLGLGGWLVIQGQLTLGQLVASELVVTVVVGAFAKAGKSLEKFYDLMAGIDKVGHLLDISVDPRQELGDVPDGPTTVRWSDLTFDEVASPSRIPAATIQAGSRVAIVGDDVEGRSRLAQTLAGLVEPDDGLAEIAGYDAHHAALAGEGRLVAYAGEGEVFHGTLQENIDLGRSGIGQKRIRDVLQQVGLSTAVLRLPDGTQTMLQTHGYPLADSQVASLILARAIAGAPKLLIIDGLLDNLNSDILASVWQSLAAPDAPWTLIVVTNQHEIAERCDSQVAVRMGSNTESQLER